MGFLKGGIILDGSVSAVVEICAAFLVRELVEDIGNGVVNIRNFPCPCVSQPVLEFGGDLLD